MLQLYGRRDLGVLLLDQFDHVGRIVEQLTGRTAFHQRNQLLVHLQLTRCDGKDHVDRVFLDLCAEFKEALVSKRLF
jgi:hypothetical protein